MTGNAGNRVKYFFLAYVKVVLKVVTNYFGPIRNMIVWILF